MQIPRGRRPSYLFLNPSFEKYVMEFMEFKLLFEFHIQNKIYFNPEMIMIERDIYGIACVNI